MRSESLFYFQINPLQTMRHAVLDVRDGNKVSSSAEYWDTMDFLRSELQRQKLYEWNVSTQAQDNWRKFLECLVVWP
jgi:hypothetical protein